MKEIVLYKTADGKCPYTDWVESLSLDSQLRVQKRVNKLKDGLKGDWKKLQNSQLCELRLDFGKGYRIYYKELDNIIILCPRNFRDKDEVVSESFEWRIRQRAAVLARVSGTSRRRRSAFP